jgi:hypothetical protein
MQPRRLIGGPAILVLPVGQRRILLSCHFSFRSSRQRSAIGGGKECLFVIIPLHHDGSD